MRAGHIKRRVVAAVFSVALAVGVLSPLATAGSQPEPTFLAAPDYDYFPHARPPVETFDGDLFSDRKSCTVDRRVRVYRKLRGADELIGVAGYFYRPFGSRGDWENTWELDVDATPQRDIPPGRYYARMKATETCGGDTSPVGEVYVDERRS